MMAYGALPLGHAHPRIVEAVGSAVASGAHFAAATEIEVEVAEMLHDIVPSAERVRFANTGTEAAMAAIRLARGFTGKNKFVKFEGHYHGWYDDFLVSSHPQLPAALGHRNDPIKIPDSSGLNQHALDDTILVPWNDLTAVERALDTHRGQVAAVISEGIMANMGVIPPEPGYLQGLRELTRTHGVLFILDETVTGCRIAPGGCQEYYGVIPDLATFGKALGSGLPVAALVGRADIMEALAWGGVLHYGTHNASRIGLYAARASLQELRRDDNVGFRQMWRIGEQLAEGLRNLFAETGTAAIVQGVGPMLQVMFTAGTPSRVLGGAGTPSRVLGGAGTPSRVVCGERSAIRDYREYCTYVDRRKYQRFALALFKYGVYMTPSAALHSIATLAHTDEDVALTLDAVRKALGDIK
jgi:glutamate-1-semialdehyde 2,1-aminomutase